jgi:chromosome segregation ATPase
LAQRDAEVASLRESLEEARSASRGAAAAAAAAAATEVSARAGMARAEEVAAEAAQRSVELEFQITTQEEEIRRLQGDLQVAEEKVQVSGASTSAARDDSAAAVARAGAAAKEVAALKERLREMVAQVHTMEGFVATATATKKRAEQHSVVATAQREEKEEALNTTRAELAATLTALRAAQRSGTAAAERLSDAQAEFAETSGELQSVKEKLQRVSLQHDAATRVLAGLNLPGVMAANMQVAAAVKQVVAMEGGSSGDAAGGGV